MHVWATFVLPERAPQIDRKSPADAVLADFKGAIKRPLITVNTVGDDAIRIPRPRPAL